MVTYEPIEITTGSAGEMMAEVLRYEGEKPECGSVSVSFFRQVNLEAAMDLRCNNFVDPLEGVDPDNLACEIEVLQTLGGYFDAIAGGEETIESVNQKLAPQREVYETYWNSRFSHLDPKV